MIKTELVPRAGAATKRSPLRAIGWAAMGTGAAAIVGGVVLMAIDEPKVKGGAQQETYRPTMTPGIVTATVGGALVVAGVILYIEGKPATGVAVGIVPLSGGGWAFSFGGEL